MEIHDQGLIRPHHSKLVFLFRMADGLIIGLSLCLAMLLYGIDLGSSEYMVLGLTAIITFSICAEGLNIYSALRTASVHRLVFPILLNWVLVIFSCLLLAYFTKSSSEYSRVALGVWLVITPGWLILLRGAVKLGLSELRKRGFNTRTVAIAGAGEQGQRLAEVIQNSPEFGYRLVGFFDNRRNGDRGGKKPAAPVLGDFDDLVAYAKSGEVDLVHIALSSKGQDRIAEIIDKLRDTTASVHLVPDFFVFDLLHSRWANIGSVPTVSVFESPFMSVHGWLKRVEDIVLSSIILTLISVPMLIIAAGVKLSSPGPIIFKQRRYGLDGKAIRVWKFRSMTTCDDGDNVVQATKNDMRVTKFGAFIRRTSLDELPQFINVLRGEMSIVGPRPHAVAHNEEYRKLISGYMLRHKVPPGITGWAQINGWRGETDTVDKMEKRIEYDLWYIRRWSVWLDLKIIFQTIFKGFRSESAY